MSENPEAMFCRYLQQEGLHVTDERRRIVAAAFSLHDHFTADELVAHLSASGVSRASVYRTLALLVQSGLVRKVDFGREASFYEHVHGDEHHDHMVCTECGGISEFFDDQIEAIQDQICNKAGFAPTGHSLKIYGVCKQCSQGSE